MDSVGSRRHVLIAPNAFKGTIEADVAADILAKAWLQKYPFDHVETCPIADGGDGTCRLLGNALKLPVQHYWTLDAVGRPILGYYFYDPVNHAAYLDVSTVSGIKHLNRSNLNPWIASTYGTGELISHACKRGIKTVYLGLGGSASIDLGIGILAGLGYQFLDEKGRNIPLFSDVFLKKIAFIQAPIQKPSIRFELLCDVTNYFFGSQGAIPVFGPQKGLHLADTENFENECARILLLFKQKSKKSVADVQGFGAAGGVGFGLSFFFDVNIHRGANHFFDLIEMEEKVKNSDIIIIGEGRFDTQSLHGKGSFELLQLSKKYEKECFLITSGDEGNHSGFTKIIRLPVLDLSSTDCKKIAQKNLFDSLFKLPLN